jgi:hypothetical protein
MAERNEGDNKEGKRNFIFRFRGKPVRFGLGTTTESPKPVPPLPAAEASVVSEARRQQQARRRPKTKAEVLEIFVRANSPLPPDTVRARLSKSWQRGAVYSYLYRLHKQELLDRKQVSGRLHYQITPRGVERLRYLQGNQTQPRLRIRVRASRQ